MVDEFEEEDIKAGQFNTEEADDSQQFNKSPIISFDQAE